jgi:hypothetical protein
MTFKQTKGRVTVRACVFPAPGGMFKGARRVTTTRRSRQLQQVSERGCGRPMPISAQALELAEIEARSLLGV